MLNKLKTKKQLNEFKVLFLMKAIVYILAFVLMCQSILALGISTTYLENNILELKTGESFDYVISLQNSENKEIKAKIVLKSEFANVLEPDTIVLSEKSFADILINVSIPQDAKPAIYDVSYSIEPAFDEELEFKLDKSFKLNITTGEFGNNQVTGAAVSNKGFKFPKEMLFIFLSGLLVAVAAKLTIKKKGSDEIPVPIPKNKVYEPSHFDLVTDQKIEEKSGLEFGSKNEFKEELWTKDTEISVNENNDFEVKEKNYFLTDPAQYFYLHSGEKLQSLDDLKSALQKMDENLFNYHVNETKNDFASWIEFVFEDIELSEKISKAKSKNQILKILNSQF